MPDRTPIGIAVVEHAGRFLVGVRGEGAALAGKAEFPGGKCRPGESPADCALRECREETGLDVAPVEFLLSVNHRYSHAHVDLHFWLCRPADAEAIAEMHGGFRWVPRGELGELDFPEANARVIEVLTGNVEG